MVQIDHVSFGYEKEQNTLYDVSFSVKRGECILLCGESGCGKTTVTKLINGLIPHFTEDGCMQGSVRAAGMPVADTEMYELAKKIGSVFQNPKSQFFNLDTDSELAFGLENEGMPPEQIRQRIAETVESLKLHGLMGRNIFSMSGGEKQTLAFASVYAMSPAVFVLDEPTANLDGEAIERLRHQIILLKEQGHTVLIAEHRLYFVADIIDRAFYFRNGRLDGSFTAEEFLQLSDSRRKEMGLRSLRETPLRLPPAGKEDEGKGLLVNGLTCGYGKDGLVFKDLCFAAVPGEVLAITGKNGIGKTTLVRCLCGLIEEQAGEIYLGGKRVKAKTRRRESFLVMQDVNHQLFYDSVWNECEQAAGQTVKDARIEEILTQFDLLSLRERHPMALSGGQKQRLAVATALLSDKKVLIFDEPTSGLDYRHMCEVGEVVRTLASQGHIVLVVSHDAEFMKRACDRVLELGT